MKLREKDGIAAKNKEIDFCCVNPTAVHQVPRH
jgi:hypothetical protein